MTTPTRGRTLRARLIAFIHAGVDRLTAAWRILTRAQTRLLDALARIRPGRGATSQIRKAAQVFQVSLAEFNRAMIAFVERWAAQDLPLAYREGALTALDHAGRSHSLWSWTARHQAAITTLSAQFYADLAGRLQEAVRRAQRFLRAAQDAARARITGFHVPTFDRAALAEQHPLGTVVYANQARHPVEAWARAAIAGQTVTVANTGTIQTAWEQLGCTQVEVRDGAQCGWASHDDRDLANGSIRDIDDALAHPLAHPNCVRQLVPHMNPAGGRRR